MTLDFLLWQIPVLMLLCGWGGIFIHGQGLWLRESDYHDAVKPYELMSEVALALLVIMGARWWSLTLLGVLYGG